MNPFRVTGQSVLLEDNRWRINTLATLPIRYQGCHDGANWKDGGLFNGKDFYIEPYSFSYFGKVISSKYLMFFPLNILKKIQKGEDDGDW